VLWRNHVFLMLYYALASGVFFALLLKTGQRERTRFFLIVFASMFVGGLALAWVMVPFPIR
jgi:hypothetical protein